MLGAVRPCATSARAPSGAFVPWRNQPPHVQHPCRPPQQNEHREQDRLACRTASPTPSRWPPPRPGRRPSPPRHADQSPGHCRRARRAACPDRIAHRSSPCLPRAAARRSSKEASWPPCSLVMFAPGKLPRRKAGACYKGGLTVSRTARRSSVGRLQQQGKAGRCPDTREGLCPDPALLRARSAGGTNSGGRNQPGDGETVGPVRRCSRRKPMPISRAENRGRIGRPRAGAAAAS